MNLLNWLNNYFSRDEKETIKVLKQQLKDCDDDNAGLINEALQLKADLKAFEETNNSLSVNIIELEEALKSAKNTVLKEYFYTKYSRQSSYTYNGMRIKRFCDSNNSETPLIIGLNNDDKANKCLKYVHEHFYYKGETKEHWQTANESIERGRGDCEDGAILMYNIMIASGIPEWRVRLNCGEVKGGGHAYITYLREANNKWYILDWCYWYSESVNFRRTWREAENYFEIWFSWNDDYVWVEPLKD